MKELIRVRVQYASRQQCCKTHKRPLPFTFYQIVLHWRSEVQSSEATNRNKLSRFEFTAGENIQCTSLMKCSLECTLNKVDNLQIYLFVLLVSPVFSVTSFFQYCRYVSTHFSILYCQIFKYDERLMYFRKHINL